MMPDVAGKRVDRMPISEVAERLDISERSVYRALRKNEIPHRWIGGLYVIFREEFERWIAGELKNWGSSNQDTAA